MTTWRHLRRICAAAAGMPLALGMLMLAGTPAAAMKATSYTLANGMQVVVLPDHRLPIVTHMVFYKVGSADDPPGQSGVAHYLEHLMFKGTPKHPAGEFDLLVTRNGGATNAYTSSDKTYYYEQVLKKGLPVMMELGADRMTSLQFPTIEAQHELSVVLEERRSYENDPDSQLDDDIDRTLFQGKAYAHPVLGEWSETGSLDYGNALAFYHAHYGPRSAILIVYGDVEPDDVRQLAEATYGQLPSLPETLPDRSWRTSGSVCSGRRIVRADDRVTRDKVTLVFPLPSAETLDPHALMAIDLLAVVLRSESLSPLYSDMVLDKGLASDVQASTDIRIAAGELRISAEASGSVKAAQIEHSLRVDLTRLLETGITQETLRLAKRNWLDGDALNSDDQLDIATHYGERLAMGATVAQIEGERTLAGSITLREINKALRAYLAPACALTAVLRRGDALTSDSSNQRTPLARTTPGVR